MADAQVLDIAGTIYLSIYLLETKRAMLESGGVTRLLEIGFCTIEQYK